MRKEDLVLFSGKKVKISGGNGNGSFFYTGFILSVSDDSIIFKDRYDKTVLIALNAIQRIEEIIDE